MQSERMVMALAGGRDMVSLQGGAVDVRLARLRTVQNDRELLANLLVPDWPASACLRHDHLGRPLCPPALGNWIVSLSRVLDSRHGPLTYGAACCARCRAGVLGLGIDAAVAVDFAVNYPLHQAFLLQELELAPLRLDDLAERMALVWAAKEAVVKALGIGFHFVDPLDVVLFSCRKEADDVYLSLCLRMHGKVRVLECLAWYEDGIWVAVCAAARVS